MPNFTFRKSACFMNRLKLALWGLAVLSASCQPQQTPTNPSASNPAPQNSTGRILTITSETNDPKLPKILIPGLELNVFAGSGKIGSKDGPALEAEFKSFGDITQDDRGNVYISDPDDAHIRKITPQGRVSTLAGTGKKVLRGKVGAFAKTEFYTVELLAFIAPDYLYASDAPSGKIIRLDLKTQESDVFIDEETLKENLSSPLQQNKLPLHFVIPSGWAVYKNDLYFGLRTEFWKLNQNTHNYIFENYAGNADAHLRTEYSIDDPEIYFKDGPPDDSVFNSPRSFAFDKAGNIFVTDSLNHRIRKIAAGSRYVSTLSGYGIPPSGMNQQFIGGFQDGAINVAQFKLPRSLVVTEQEDLLIQDANKEGAIRLLSQGQVRTIIHNCTCLLLKDNQKNQLYILDFKSLLIYTLALADLEKLKPQILKQEPRP